MTAGNQRPQSLRIALPSSGTLSQPELFEALRDLYTQLAGLSGVKSTRFTGQWSVPFAIAFDHEPQNVFLANSKLLGTPITIDGGLIAYQWTGRAVLINAASNLLPGTLYDLTFLVVG